MFTSDLFNSKKKVSEGSTEASVPDPVVVISDQNGKMLDSLRASIATQKYNLGSVADIKNQLAHQDFTTIGNYVVSSPMAGQPIDEVEEEKLDDTSEAKEADYGDEYQAMVKRVGKLAKEGPRKTVWDPVKRVYKTVPVNPPKTNKVLSQSVAEEQVDENLRNWFKDKWVRFGPDGKIRGDCARGDDSEGKPKCLPQSKAQALGKKGRASAAAKKRREDPNPERSGKAINVSTKTNEAAQAKLSAETVRRIQNFLNDKFDANLDVDGILGPLTIKSIKEFMPASLEKLAPNPERTTAVQGKDVKSDSKKEQVDEKWSEKYKRSVNCSHPKGFSQKAHCLGKKKRNESLVMEMICPDCGMCETHGDHSSQSLDEACWKGYHKEGMKTMFGKRYPNCIKNKNESLETYIRNGECPGCGGTMVAEGQLNEKQDACYHKVKSRYKVWPSAYASGALVQCRKKGASNWGNKSEGVAEGKMAELEIDLEDPEITDRQFEKMYGMSRQEAQDTFTGTNAWEFPDVRDPSRPLHEKDVAEADSRSSAKTGIYQTDVFGAKAYHAKCMEPNCDWESRRYDRIKQAQDSAKKHAQTHIKPDVAEQVSPDFFNRPDDEPYIPPTTPVRLGDFEFDARSFIGGLGDQNAQGLQIRAYDPKKPKGDQLIGSVDFIMKTDKKGNTWLESDDTRVDEPYRGRGVAAMMYAFAKSLGNDIKASPYQSNAGKSMWGKWGNDAKNLVGEQGSVNEVLNTPATGVQWDTSDPELVSANFTASNGVPYELGISAPFASPDEIGPYDFFDVDIPDDIYDASRFVEFSTKSDQPYAKGKQGIEGTGSAAEVFGIVTNALLQYTKKYKPAMLYFQAAEPSRQRLYAAIVNRMIKSLPGWAAKQQGQSNFAIYNQRLLKRQGVTEGRNFNDDDWYEINPDTLTIVNQYGPRALSNPMGNSKIQLPNGNIAVKGLRAKYMDLNDGEKIDEAVSGLELADVLYNGLEQKYPNTVRRFGHEVVANAVLDAVEANENIDSMSEMDALIDELYVNIGGAETDIETPEPQTVPAIKEALSQMEAKLYFNVIGTSDSQLRGEFGMRRDPTGWFLTSNSGKSRIMEAQRAFGSPRIL